MEILKSKILKSGDRWSASIAKGKLIKFTALEDNANISMLMYNFFNLSEHYNAPDTLKAQHSFYLKRGHAIISDSGRALASIVEDTVGWHDSTTGYTTRAMTDEKYGYTDYQTNSNNYYKSGQENLVNELIKNGMSIRDLMPTVNLFTKVEVDERGELIFVANHSKKGDYVTIRTEMNTYMVLSNTPNPLNPSSEYPATEVLIEISEAEEVQEDDYCRNFSEYTKRAFENAEEYNRLLGL